MIIEAINISKSYISTEDYCVFKNANLNIKTGEISGIIGNSGCGKTTLLQILGLIDKPTTGIIKFNGQELKNDDVSKLLAKNISFIYQLHHLLPEFSVIENVIIPQIIAGFSKSIAIKNAKEILEKLGLKDKIHNKPHMLSGGERQRTAIARAVAKKPQIIFADEPTGNLDPENAQKAFELMINIAKDSCCAIFYVTHNHDFIQKFDRCYTIKNKELISLKS